jgi:predicted regulator of Ras-like GTPase activity (Roadblock/LC7/MglB family)
LIGEEQFIMKSGLREINEIDGVWASLVCDNQGNMIEVNSPPALNESDLENIPSNVLDLMTTTSGQLEGLEEVVIHYQERTVFALDLTQAVLVVIGTPSVDVSLLRLSVNVVLARWMEDTSVQKLLKKRFVERE